MAADRVRLAAEDRAVAAVAVGGKADWQANTAPEDSVDPGRIAIHNRVVVVVPAAPVGAGVVAVRRFPISRSVNQDVSCLPVSISYPGCSGNRYTGGNTRAGASPLSRALAYDL